jgi:ubiquinone/menaquinone biosynthesis C-methylase UbiE
MNTAQEKDTVEGKKQPEDQTRSKTSRWLWLRRSPALLDPLRRLFEHPKRLIEPYVKDGQVVADLGCGSGYYTFALAELVGSAGKVYAIDLDKGAIRALAGKAEKGGYRNIEIRAVSAADVSFIRDKSVDFVLANGLLCSMASNRQSAVNEIKRILKSTGKAYISLGFGPPLGLVDKAEWEKILEGFRVEQGGSYKEKWAVVSSKEE